MFDFKYYLKKYYPNIFEIFSIIFNNILLKKKIVKFSGWGLKTTTSVPWEKNLKNNTSLGFIKAKKILDKKIKSKKFYLAQIENYHENKTFLDVLRHYNELNYRHYVVYYSSLIAFENTKSRNIVECGVAEGLTVYFCLVNYIKDKDFKAYLYDSWERMRRKELKTKKDLKREGKYSYLDLNITKKNLKDFNSNIIYKKGYIPSIFNKKNNPRKISWLHIDLNSAYPTLETLKYFFPKLETNGVILLDDYGHLEFEDTKKVVENFFKNKKIQFLHLMTGQAMIIKKK